MVAGHFHDLVVPALALVRGQGREPGVAHRGAPLVDFVGREAVVRDLVHAHHVLVRPVPHLVFGWLVS